MRFLFFALFGLLCSYVGAQSMQEEIEALQRRMDDVETSLKNCGCTPTPVPTTKKATPTPTPTTQTTTTTAATPAATTAAIEIPNCASPPIPLVPGDVCTDVPRSFYDKLVKVKTVEQKYLLCDTETDGGNWTIIQRRFDGSEDFERTMREYEAHFGTVDGEFWSGLNSIYHSIRKVDYELRIDFTISNPGKPDTRWYAKYGTFKLENAIKYYKLTVGDYSGTAGDFFTTGLAGDNLNGMMFSTKDSDQDKSAKHCARDVRMGGWWYNDCSDSNLNGQWNKKKPTGVFWGPYDNIKYVTMMIRPKH